MRLLLILAMCGSCCAQAVSAEDLTGVGDAAARWHAGGGDDRIVAVSLVIALVVVCLLFAGTLAAFVMAGKRREGETLKLLGDFRGWQDAQDAEERKLTREILTTISHVSQTNELAAAEISKLGTIVQGMQVEQRETRQILAQVLDHLNAGATP